MANRNSAGGRRVSRKQITLLWIAGVAVVIITLLYFERADVLYVLSTLGVTALLGAVAFADLSGSKKNPATGEDWNATKKL
ncbi:MAG: hypothetical protein ABIP75_16310 [Pyrinomonadaceae bacterium]